MLTLVFLTNVPKYIAQLSAMRIYSICSSVTWKEEEEEKKTKLEVSLLREEKWKDCSVQKYIPSFLPNNHINELLLSYRCCP